MFSGIIQNQGRVIKKQKRGGRAHFVFKLKRKERNLVIGESVAVNGVCLTVTHCRELSGAAASFAADAIKETLEATALGSLGLNDDVNLERSLRFGDRISGHFVTGHVDGRGTIESILRRKGSRVLTVKAPSPILALLAVKGSIAIDGVSLTIQSLTRSGFQIALVPQTLKTTNLKDKKSGDQVNLEIDLVTRYLDVLSRAIPKASSKASLKRLKKEGF